MKKISTELHSRRLRLEPFSPNLVTAEYLEWMRDPEIGKYLVKASNEITLQEVEEFAVSMINSSVDYFFGIFDKESNRHIGNVRLGPIDFREGYSFFGIMIGNRSFQGKGLGREATELIIDFCFKDLGLKKFCLDVVEEHIAAVKIYKKLGLKIEHRLEGHIRKGGISYDALRMYRLNPNYSD